MTNDNPTDITPLGVVTYRRNADGGWWTARLGTSYWLGAFDTYERARTVVRLMTGDLRGAKLYEADLTEAHLRGADLTEADLGDACLRGVDLAGADLTHTYLSGGSTPTWGGSWRPWERRWPDDLQREGTRSRHPRPGHLRTQEVPRNDEDRRR